MIRVVARKLGSLRVSESLEAAPNPEVDLDVMEFALSIDKLESVTGVSVHVAVTLWGSTIGEENHNLVDGLWVLREVILEEKRISEHRKRVDTT